MAMEPKENEAAEHGSNGVLYIATHACLHGSPNLGFRVVCGFGQEI